MGLLRLDVLCSGDPPASAIDSRFSELPSLISQEVRWVGWIGQGRRGVCCGVLLLLLLLLRDSRSGGEGVLSSP